MEIFLRYLDEMLTKEDKNWKKNTLLIWDGAGYHHAAETIEVAKRLQLPLLQLGPYGYLMNPTELLFSQLKNAQLNPHHGPVGKK